jgi:hypothetical protein
LIARSGETTEERATHVEKCCKMFLNRQALFHRAPTLLRAYHASSSHCMLDVGLFRAGRPGGDPDLVRESQRKRFADVGLVDQVIDIDEQWRKRNFIIIC